MKIIRVMLITALLLFALGPLLTALADIFCWLVLGHAVTGLDWGGDRVGAAVLWTFVMPFVSGAVISFLMD